MDIIDVLPVDGGTGAEPELTGVGPVDGADRTPIALSRAAMRLVRASAGASRGAGGSSPASEVGGSAGGTGGGSGWVAIVLLGKMGQRGL